MSETLAPAGRREPGTVLGAPLYVHVPFCAAKCHYCDFYSFAADAKDAVGFVEILLREAEHRGPRRPATVFLGGGTPSWLQVRDLEALLVGLDDLTGFRASGGEVTVECNPESAHPEKLAVLRERGVTRISIGVQSLRQDLLALFGRVHGPAEAERAFAAARDAGFADLSVDLIYGAPGQVLEQWEADLAAIASWRPDHVSAYSLAFEPGTAFERERRAGRMVELDEELALRFFLRTRELLGEAGLAAYEISNFARPGRACRHNLNYWRNGPYVGLGPSAVSKLGHRRAGNARSLLAWRTAVEATGSGEEWSETLGPLGRLGETWWLGLRTTDGVDPAEARATADWGDEPDPAEAVAADLEIQGLLRRCGSRFALTATGLPVADAVAARFLALDAAVPRGA